MDRMMPHGFKQLDSFYYSRLASVMFTINTVFMYYVVFKIVEVCDDIAKCTKQQDVENKSKLKKLKPLLFKV